MNEWQPAVNLNHDAIVHFCPFCEWAVTFTPDVNTADLEQVLRDHLTEHVSEMLA